MILYSSNKGKYTYTLHTSHSPLPNYSKPSTLPQGRPIRAGRPSFKIDSCKICFQKSYKKPHLNQARLSINPTKWICYRIILYPLPNTVQKIICLFYIIVTGFVRPKIFHKASLPKLSQLNTGFRSAHIQRGEEHVSQF